MSTSFSSLRVVLGAVLTVFTGATVSAKADIIISGIETWYPESNPYVIQERIEIQDGAILTLRPGVEIRFGETVTVEPAWIEVLDGGKLDARGTAALPITFTSDFVSPGPGDWGSIVVRDGAILRLDHCNLRYGGWSDSPALDIESSDVEVRNTTIMDADGPGVRIAGTGNASVYENVAVLNCAGAAFQQTTPDMSPAFSGLFCSGNIWDGILVMQGVILRAVTWGSTGVPYILEGWIDIGDGGTLNVAAGSTVLFKDATSLLQSSIRVLDDGHFFAYGTQADPITFSSALADPAPGDWGYVRIYGTAHARMEYCNLRYGGSIGSPTLWIQSPDVIVEHCAVRDGLSHGIVLDGAGITPVLNHLTIESCLGAALRLTTPDMHPQLGENLAFNGNEGGDVIYIYADGGVIGSDNEWNITAVSYAVSGWLYVQDGATLTVRPGVEVQFAPAAASVQSNIRVRGGGRLDALGTVTDPILFTSFYAEPTPGDWGYVHFLHDGAGLIEHAILEYGGNFTSPTFIIESSDVIVRDTEVRYGLAEGVKVVGVIAPTLERVSVIGCASWAVNQSDINATPQYSRLLLRDNVFNAVRIDADTAVLARDVRLAACGAPYALAGGARVGAGGQLTVDPGVVVQFAPVGTALQSYLSVETGGELVARGTPNQRIVFTSANTTPAPGDWAYVQVLPDAQAYLSECTFEYGGQAQTGMLDIQSGSVVFSRCLVRNSAREGLFISGQVAPLIFNSHIQDNATYGVLNITPNVTIDARGTWWGDASGPFHPVLNPDGEGNQVSDGVLFDPWATQATLGPVLAVSPTTVRIPPSGGTVAVEVRNSGDGVLEWSGQVTSGAAWLTATRSRGGGEGWLYVSVASHTGDYQRVGRIQVNAPGVSSSTTVLVAQAGVLGVGGPHTADIDADYQADLTELLRVIQFYNSGGFHCAPGTEDGYAPGPGYQDCDAHDSDYNPTDWDINIVELLRLIQFYNSGGYHNNEAGEDSYGPGAL